MTRSNSTFESPAWMGPAIVFLSLAIQNLGAAFAKYLFPLVGAAGMTTLRIGLAAMLLLLIRRPWRSVPGREHVGAILRYGAMLGLMNLVIYQAFARIPIGIAVAIEVLGPLAVVLAGAKRRADFVWLFAALLGLGLLLPLKAQTSSLDLLGIAFALAAAASWALYIVFGKRLAGASSVDGVAWGMLVAAIFTAPLGIWQAGSTLLTPNILLMGLAVAALSSALPYSLEMIALRRVPAHVFGILVSSAPAVAALAGFLVLGESLQAVQWLAICLIMVAVAGSTLSARRKA
ncbi:EamA family transporter [Aromatoleum sp.]|uniref:EamA family transporter n=1 Tax=Aromatoleum sp. TaxID=2307007 RepID=UPI002B4873AC|nr:EamA family transporter [Aromatoleum sp.]